MRRFATFLFVTATITLAPMHAGVAGAVCTITGTPGDDLLLGTDGPDVICGLRGADEIRGLAGNDALYGGPGPDVIYGGRGADRLIGGGAGDVMFGNTGGDLLRGGFSSDYLFAGKGADVMRAGKGNDGCLNGVDGRPNDALLGGPGTDRFDADRGDALSSVEVETFKCFEGQRPLTGVVHPEDR